MTKHLKKFLVRFNGLQLLDREFIPWRVSGGCKSQLELNFSEMSNWESVKIPKIPDFSKKSGI